MWTYEYKPGLKQKPGLKYKPGGSDAVVVEARGLLLQDLRYLLTDAVLYCCATV